MPVRMFWKLFEEIDRLRAEELAEWMPVHMAAMGGGAKQLYARLQGRIGTPLVFEVTGGLTNEARERLRKHFG